MTHRLRLPLIVTLAVLTACQSNPAPATPVAAPSSLNLPALNAQAVAGTFNLSARVPTRVSRGAAFDVVLTLMNTSAELQQVDMNLCPVGIQAKSLSSGAITVLVDPAATLCARYIRPVTLAPGGSARYELTVPPLNRAGDFTLTFSTRYGGAAARVTAE